MIVRAGVRVGSGRVEAQQSVILEKKTRRVFKPCKLFLFQEVDKAALHVYKRCMPTQSNRLILVYLCTWMKPGASRKSPRRWSTVQYSAAKTKDVHYIATNPSFLPTVNDRFGAKAIPYLESPQRTKP